MKKIALIVVFSCFFTVASKAQVIFKIIVQQPPLIAGESFQVQYIIEEADAKDQFTIPEFKNLRLVSGPHISAGSAQSVNGRHRLKNITFTLEASQAGQFIIPGTTATVNGINVKCSPTYINVITKEDARLHAAGLPKDALNGDNFLQPGEDPYRKIRDNLFIKVDVNKRSCYTGEPVVATYKLYSRLQSNSDIVKNPGFYGFTVQDMIQLDDKVVNMEMINGTAFDVHTLRKVQLFPLQAGTYTIDEMEINNKISFYKSYVGNKTETQIEEGVYQHKDAPAPANTVSFETSIHSEPINITVKPVPAYKPADYNGATGNFEITMEVERSELAKNEEGDLLVTINGSGNFTQLSPPTITWPIAVEGFDATITDELDKMQTPIAGKRVFRFPFSATRTGNFTLPAIRFTFFNPDSNHFKTVTTKAVTISVKDSSNLQLQPATKKQGQSKVLASTWIIAAAITALLAIIVFIFVSRRRRVIAIAPKPLLPEVLPVDVLLQPARLLVPAEDKTFYTALHQGIWKFLSQRFALDGINLNKYELLSVLQRQSVPPDLQQSLMHILAECETGVYTNVQEIGSKGELFERARTILSALDRK